MDFNYIFTPPIQNEWCESQTLWSHELTWLREPFNTMTGIIFFAVFYSLLEITNLRDIIYTVLCIGIGTMLYHATLFPIFKLFDQMSIFLLLLYIIFHKFYSLKVCKKYIDFLSLIFIPLFLTFPAIGDLCLFVVGVALYKYIISFKLYYNHLIFLWISSMFFWGLDRFCISFSYENEIYYLHTHWIFHILIGLLSYYGIIYLETIVLIENTNKRNIINKDIFNLC